MGGAVWAEKKCTEFSQAGRVQGWPVCLPTQVVGARYLSHTVPVSWDQPPNPESQTQNPKSKIQKPSISTSGYFRRLPMGTTIHRR